MKTIRNPGTHEVSVNDRRQHGWWTALSVLIGLAATWEAQSAGCLPPPLGLVAWWPGDRNAQDLVGSNHGTVMNGATFAPGKVDQAFNFNGNGGYVETPLDVQPSAMPSSTWTAWVLPTRVNYDWRQQIISDDDGGYDRSVLIEQGSANFAVFTGSGVWSPTAVSPNQWQHIAVVFSPSNIEFYKNGVRYSFGAAPVGGDTPYRLQIGRNPGYGEYFQGRIDEVSIYSRALSAAEIQAIFNADNQGLCKQDPSIASQPSSQVKPCGAGVTFTVEAWGTGPFYCQWFLNATTLIPGATNWTLRLANVQTADGGLYSVVVSGARGSVTSTPASLTVVPVVIETQPLSQQAILGSTVTFSVTAQGRVPLAYQWFFNQTNLLADATNRVLTLTNVQSAQAGNYHVVVTSVYGAVASATATLEVRWNLGNAVNRPEWTWTTGGSAVWFGQKEVTHDGVAAAQSGPLSDSQESWLQTSVTGPGTVAFWWKVSSEGDCDYLEFYVGGVLRSRISGGVNWQQVAFAVPSGTQTLRWRYTKDVGMSSGYDRAWVDEVVFVPTAGAPVILVQPASQRVVVGVNVSLQVSAGGGTPLFYQWFYNETNAIPGATNATVTLTNVQLAAAGVYSATVTNRFGSVTSSSAVLTVTTNGPVDITLLLVDGEVASPYETILINRNQPYQRFTDETFLNLAIDTADPATTLVVVDSTDGAQNLESLVNYVKAGGRAILQYWNLTAGSTLAAAFNVTVVETLSAPMPVYDWGGSTLFAGVGSPLNLVESGFGVDGQKLQPTTGGQSVGGYVSTRTANQAALVIGNSNRTILHGFLLEDASLSTAASRLARNEIEFLIGAPPASVAPFITGQPHSQTICVGAGMAFTVAAAGTPPLNYQWYFDETNALAGATNATLTLTNVQAGDRGSYRVTVSNPYGVAASSNAVLTVTTNSQVNTTLLLVDGPAASSFETALMNRGQPYQRFTDDPTLSSALRSANPANTLVIIDSSTATHVFTELESFVNAGGRALVQYWALAPGHSLAAALDATVLATFTSPLRVYDWGGTSLFGGITSPLNLQEMGSVIDGQKLQPTAQGRAVAGFVSSPSVNEAAVVIGNFGRTLVNGFLLEDASSAEQAVRFAENEIRFVIETTPTPPYLRSFPWTRTDDAGTTATFSVQAGGTEPLHYQWCKDGMTLVDGGHVAGARTTVLTVRDVLKHDEGSYTVLVTNDYGAVTSPVAKLTVIDPLITDQPVSQTGEPGQNVQFTVTAAGTPPLTYQWFFNESSPLPGATNSSLTLSNVQAADAGKYRVVVSNPYGSVTSAVAPLTVSLAALDPGFNPELSGEAYSLAVQPDAKILVGGWFTTLGGQPPANVARLNVDGTLDPGFNLGTDAAVWSLAVQADGKILVGGEFTTLGGQPRLNIGRLNADGTLDPGFTPGTDAAVWSLAVQADGKILVGGWFTTLGGQPRNYIGRLNPDGTLDAGFNPGAGEGDGYYPFVSSLVVQADGKILVGGSFSILGGRQRLDIGRLNANGTVDTEFDPALDGSGYVTCLAMQTDRKILVGGGFNSMGGLPRLNVGRLNPDGTPDALFDPEADNWLYSMAVQADGKILVGGAFSMLGGQPRSRIGRLHADGTLDLGFNPGTDGVVWSLALQADGKILVGGGFTVLAGQPRNGIGRLLADSVNPAPSITVQPTDQTVEAGSTATFWAVATGSAPLVFQWFFNETTALVGATNSTLTLSNVQPADAGDYGVLVTNALGSVTSAVATLTVVTVPQIVVQPCDQIVNAGSNATFSVTAMGAAPLRYQWHFYGTNLSLLPWRWRPGETPTNATLTLTNVGPSRLGPYFVVVSNAYGAVTSAVVTLDYLYYPPAIVRQPSDQTVIAGEDATFKVTVTNNATLPISYQLRKGTTPVTEVLLYERTCTLTLCNVPTNSTAENGPGAYRVVARNAANFDPGIGSRLASLTVVRATPPGVTTLPASGLTTNQSILQGTVNPNGAATAAWFEYGLTSSYGNWTSTTNVGNGTNRVEVSMSISGLLPGTDYHYCLVAMNYGDYGIATLGQDLVFQTAPLPTTLTITGCAMLEGHRFQIQFEGEVGTSYSVLRSMNLTDWEVIGPATETVPGQFEFTDADAPNHATCFYRLRSP